MLLSSYFAAHTELRNCMIRSHKYFLKKNYTVFLRLAAIHLLDV